MLYFEVIAHPQRVVVKELVHKLKLYHVSANVDGEIWRYQIKKSTGGKMADTWYGRGLQQAFYHAKNSGEHVVFERVYHKKMTRKQKITNRQLGLF